MQKGVTDMLPNQHTHHHNFTFCVCAGMYVCNMCVCVCAWGLGTKSVEHISNLVNFGLFPIGITILIKYAKNRTYPWVLTTEGPLSRTGYDVPCSRF